MTVKEFFNELSNSREDIVQKLLVLLQDNSIHYCVIGGLAVNAYVEPLVSLDLDIVIAVKELIKFKRMAADEFRLEEFAHSINLYSSSSDLRIQIQTDERYQAFIHRASEKETLGYKMYVASLEDTLQGKIWAYSDNERKKSKRQKDLADIFRLVEAFPVLKNILPDNIAQLY
ncbi:MAG: hypothetical protein ABIL68_02120 [bacterium]